MATGNTKFEQGDDWRLIATGPQPVTFNFKTGVGEYATEVDPNTPPPNGIYAGLKPTSLALSAGEKLYAKGYGDFVAIADTLDF